MSRWAWLGTWATLLIFISGCAVLARGVFSAPQADGAASKHDMGQDPDDGIVLTGPYGNIQFELPGLDFSVKAVSGQVFDGLTVGPVILVPLPLIPWPPGIIGLFFEPRAARPPLVFELELDPEGEEVSFNPMRSVLQTPEGRTIKPSGFDGPAYGYRGIYTGTPCGPPSESNRSAQIPLYQWSCFRLRFDTAISAEKNFTLLIQGVERDGQPVPVPPIHFQKGTTWRRFVVG